jgi:taurine transport system substrate-binding protein
MRAAGRYLFAIFFGVGFWSADPAPARSENTLGYQLMYNPWKVAIADGTIERETASEITWRRFASGAKVINAIASGAVQVAPSGSSPIAAGISRGLDIEVVWVFQDIAAAEALVVRDGAGIEAPQDLKGKIIGVPFASTTHFHVLFALEQFGIEPNEVTIRNMQPPEIAEAWEKGEIDAAFVWDPALGRIKKTGRVLITSGLLSSWGKATFDAMVADRRFAAENPEFMCRLIKTIAATDAAYRSDPGAWGPDSEAAAAIADLVGGEPADVPLVLELYVFPSLEEQLSDRWLGGGKNGGVARALTFTAEFLKNENKVRTLSEDYSRHVNPTYARMVRDGAC